MFHTKLTLKDKNMIVKSVPNCLSLMIELILIDTDDIDMVVEKITK